MASRESSIHISVLVLACLALLFLPIHWICACFIAAVVHELGHYIAIWFLSETPGRFHISVFTAKLELPCMSVPRELVCTIAGPLAGFVLLLFSKWIPRIALCAWFQTMWNLMPIYPMDGGRVIRCIIKLVCPPEKERYVIIVVDIFCTAICLACWAYFAVRFQLESFWPILAIAVFLLKNPLAKYRNSRYNRRILK